ncbi:MAG: TRAP transporter large permease [Deltaproteobacteria bacterium]|nr:TRAP transporter large permease [Deltaproteobacteria bacterium]MBW2312129.1 TRAP transporter large permease [Deltaproteobacteria bacterium]
MTIVLTVMALVVVIMLLGVPVGFAFGLGGFVILFLTGMDPRFAIPAAFRNLESYTLLALPLFIMAGGLMRDADISQRLIAFTLSFLGRIRGGLGVVCVVSCTIFGAISGSASAAIAAIGSVLIPEMVKQGYPRGYSTGLVAASSMLALLIPPSIPMIVFAMTAQISILSAFLSTLIPGILMMTVYCVINLIMSRKMEDLEITPRKGLWETFSGIAYSTKHAGFALFMPILVLGGIYGGVFTPTEAAAISGFYAVLVGFILYRTMTFKNMCLNIKSSMITSGAVMILLFFILMVSRIMVAYQVPQYLTSFIFKLTTNKFLVLIMINVILLFMGMLVDDVSGNILSAAILLPIAKSVGIDPIHFAAISVTNLSLGNITPPCAPMLYLAGLIGGNLPLNEYVKPASYFMIFGALPVILAVTYVPEFALVLVNLFLR